MDYTVMIPVYNEEKLIQENTEKLIEYLDKADVGAYEIMICSNGSTDKTDELGVGLTEKHPGKVRFITVSKRGVGYAFKKMVETASTEKLVSFDMDLSSNLDYISDTVKLLDEYDLVIGSKNMGDQKRKFHRRFISDVFLLMVRILLGLSYKDYSINAKGWLRSSIIPFIDRVDHGSSYVIDLTYNVKKAGGNIIETPVYVDDKRGSKFNIINEIIYRFTNLVRLRLKNL